MDSQNLLSQRPVLHLLPCICPNCKMYLFKFLNGLPDLLPSTPCQPPPPLYLYKLQTVFVKLLNVFVKFLNVFVQLLDGLPSTPCQPPPLALSLTSHNLQNIFANFLNIFVIFNECICHFSKYICLDTQYLRLSTPCQPPPLALSLTSHNLRATQIPTKTAPTRNPCKFITKSHKIII